MIPVIYQDGYDGKLVVGLSCLTEWVYSRYFFNRPIRSKEQLWWQQFLWIFDLIFFYKTYLLWFALTANLVDFRS